MFGKTREKLEEKYVKPAQKAITVNTVLSVLALLIAIMALMTRGA